VRHIERLALALALGCGAKDTSSESGSPTNHDSGASEDSDGGAPDEDGGPVGSEDFPSNPGPFSISLSDGSNLNFDLPSCQHFRGSTNFRAFWRDYERSHNYVLTIQVMQTFDGAGTYSSTDHRAEVRLLEESPSTGVPTYWTDSSGGDTTAIQVIYIDDERAWGEATVSGLHDAGSGAPIALSPNTLPIWCPEIEI
jgi:hypothetical protein